MTDPAITLAAKVRVYGKVSLPNVNGCMLWLGSLNDKGYGRVRFGGQKVYAHRAAYAIWVGQIPEGLVIDHLCRIPACVAPDHLEPVTHRSNILRGVGPAAANTAKTHCKNGHEFTAESMYRTIRGERRCRICARAKRADLEEVRN